MSVQTLHTTKKLIQTFCNFTGLPVDCFVEGEMFCAVLGNDDYRILISVFGESEPEQEFFLSDRENEFIGNITK